MPLKNTEKPDDDNWHPNKVLVEIKICSKAFRLLF